MVVNVREKNNRSAVATAALRNAGQIFSQLIFALQRGSHNGFGNEPSGIDGNESSSRVAVIDASSMMAKEDTGSDYYKGSQRSS